MQLAFNYELCNCENGDDGKDENNGSMACLFLMIGTV